MSFKDAETQPPRDGFSREGRTGDPAPRHALPNTRMHPLPPTQETTAHAVARSIMIAAGRARCSPCWGGALAAREATWPPTPPEMSSSILTDDQTTRRRCRRCRTTQALNSAQRGNDLQRGVRYVLVPRLLLPVQGRPCDEGGEVTCTTHGVARKTTLPFGKPGRGFPVSRVRRPLPGSGPHDDGLLQTSTSAKYMNGYGGRVSPIRSPVPPDWGPVVRGKVSEEQPVPSTTS